MKLSIIVPVYNVEKYIDKCLYSIQKQTITDWECLLIDDGSTDKSGAICEYYSAKDKRFKVVHKFNSGVVDTRNLGIYLAKGDYIGFVDSDDFLDPARYQKALEAAESKQYDIVRCDLRQIKINGETTIWTLPKGEYDIKSKILLSTSAYDNSGVVQSIYKSELVKGHNLYFRDCDYGEDWLFNVEAFTHAGKLYSLGEPLYNYIRHENSLSKSDLDPKRYLRMLHALNKACEELDTVPNFIYFKDIVLNNFYTRKSTLSMRKNHIDYVVPFVDNSDPVWIEQYNKYSPVKKDLESNGVQRFRADTELFKYQFRGIEKYMPFVGVIHLLVSSKSQVPDWIDQSKIHIVEHKDFIPEKFLPTFNSSTIEMFLHNIPGLSEKFIYGNDDFYYTYDLKSKFYFDEKNNIISRLEPHPLSEGNNPPLWKKIFINSYNLAKFGTTDIQNNNNVYYVPPHIEQGMLKSKIAEIYKKFEKDILASCTRFRDPKNLNQYLFTNWLILNDQYKNGCHSYRNFNASAKKIDIINAVTNPNKDKVIRSFVLNDTGDTSNMEFLKTCLNKLLPNKSKYEK